MHSMYFALSASVQKVLWPFMTTLPSLRTNEVVMALLSEPACGSLRPRQKPIASPSISLSMTFFCCSGVPNFSMSST